MRAFLLTMIVVVTAFIAALIQHSFISALGSPWSAIDLPLFITFFAVSIFDDRFAFGFFAVASVAASFIATQALFTPLIVGIAVCIALNELIERFFTNRTYYAVLAIGGIGWLLYYVLLWLVFSVFRLLDVGPSDAQAIGSPISMLVGAGALLVFLTMSYVFTVLLSKRIRSYFIVADRP